MIINKHSLSIVASVLHTYRMMEITAHNVFNDDVIIQSEHINHETKNTNTTTVYIYAPAMSLEEYQLAFIS